MQVEGGTSLPSQLSECRSMAARQGLEVVAEYIDSGESARTDERPQFQQMIADARHGRFGAIVTWDNSRFARNREDAVTYKALLRRHGVRLLFVNEPVIEGPVGSLVDSVLEAVAEFYVANLGESTRRGLEETVRQGYFSGGPPLFGYRREVVSASGKRKSRLVPDPVNSRAVRDVYRWYASGMSLREIARRLNSTGVIPPRAKEWTPAAVQHILFKYRDQYLGTFSFGRKPEAGRPEPTVSIQVEPLVDPALAEAVDAAARGRRNIGKFGSEPRLLTGLAHCGNCGRRLMVGGGPGAGGKRVGYYHCPGKCGQGWIRCETAERLVLDSLSSFLEGEGPEGLVDAMARQYAARLGRVEQDRASVMSAIAELSRRRDNLLFALENGSVAPEDVRDRLLDLRQKIAVQRSTLEKMEYEPRKSIMTADIMRKKIIALLSSGSRRGKRAALNVLLERIDFHDGLPRITFAIPEG